MGQVSQLYPGRTIADRYRVLRVLGRGGMGVVSEVETIDTGQHFAIKFLREDVQSDIQPNARFLREAKLATHLSSPHICRIFNVGHWELGPYIVMELLEGRALSSILERGKQLDYKRATRIAYEMCDALAEAHALGIVHRDVKPGNVFLARTADSQALVKVLDFGVAKIPASVVTKHGEHSLTDSSTLLGTPSYVAPEQLINSKLVDARADVWAVGVMLYEMLAGQLPFSSPLVPKLLVMIAREEPAFLASLAPLVPDELVRIVHRCLCKNPAQRHCDARVLQAALLPWVDRTADLLAPLLVVPSARPSLRATEPPPSEPTGRHPTKRPFSDSLGPHTTANLRKHRYSAGSIGRYVAGGACAGAVAAMAYILTQRGPATELRHLVASEPKSPTIVAAAYPVASAHQVVVMAEPPQAHFELDGTALTSNPIQLAKPDDGVDHQLVITAPGYLTERRQLRFGADQQISIALRPVPSAPLAPGVPDAASSIKPATAPPTRIGSGASAAPSAPSVKLRTLDRQNPF